LSLEHDFHSQSYITSKEKRREEKRREEKRREEKTIIANKQLTIRKEAVIAIFKTLLWQSRVHTE
jgi:hypothetical protein